MTADVQAGKAPGERLGDRATRGAFWTLLGFAGSQIIRLGGNLVLTRLLFEEAFGIMALIATFLQGLNLFSDIGIGPAIIQSERGEQRRFLDTAWTIQAGRGFVLWLVACAGAIPFANFYQEPLLAVFIPVVGVTAIFNGFNSTKLFTANRALTLGPLTIIEIASQALGTITMIAWAFVDRSVWALISGALVRNVAKLVLSHVLLPGRTNRLRFDGAAARALFRFGRWIFVSTLLSFFAGQSDRLIFGKMIPLDLLGVYSIGMMIASLPSTALATLSRNVTFPVFSRVFRADEPMDAAYRRTRMPILLLGGWAMCGLMAGGPTAIRLLYDPRYAEAGWIVQLLAFGMWFLVIETVNMSMLLAQGRVRWVAVGALAKVIAMILLILAGHHLFEFPGAVAGYALSEFFRYAVGAYATRRSGLRGLRQDLGLTLFVVAVAGPVWLAARALRAWEAPVVVEAAAVALTVSLAWLPLGLPHIREYLARRRARRP